MENVAPETIDLSCKEAARLMSQRHDRALTVGEAESLKQHLYVCLNCTRFDRQLEFLRRLAQKYAAGGSVDDQPI
ncbi:MAG: zf-HC2 domain-containing protein [Betaproteobacteria bacterium]|nr:zf-HC2 domain-containing protein [Betaproteobacteria bacterium]